MHIDSEKTIDANQTAGSSPKQPWHTPEIEEVDLAETQNAHPTGTVFDIGLYS